MVANGHSEEDFPWGLNVFDAHCHPTDTMSTVSDISKMNTKVLIVMATRAQDQHLVDDVANDMELKAAEAHKLDSADWRGIVPSFGWHPWFSHQIYDDYDHQDGHSQDGGGHLTEEQRIAHYQSVLDPSPTDHAFISRLPLPRSLSSLLTSTSDRLSQHPLALIGEVGLDKAFRIPEAWLPEQVEERDDGLTPGGREGRKLSSYRVDLDHQKKVLLAQLWLAGRMQRAVSVHGVQAHGHLYETLRQTWAGREKQTASKKERKERQKQKQQLEKAIDQDPLAQQESQQEEDCAERQNETSAGKHTHTYPPRVCLHSFSGPKDTLKQYLHSSVPVQFFFSFSIVINFNTSASNKAEQCIKALPDDRILIESDMHIAGERMDQHLKEIAIKICDLKGWELEHGVKQLGSNWRAFVFGEDVGAADDAAETQ